MLDPLEKTTVNDAYRPPQTDSTVTHNSNYAMEENYGIIDWFKKGLRNYTNFSGRARRKEYWYFVLMQFILIIAAMILDAILFDNTPIFYVIVALGLFIPGLAVTIRRLHDTSRSGWWFLISFIPIIGSILILVYLASETKFETNQWGPPAK